MELSRSHEANEDGPQPASYKIMIGGGSGAGKTTFISAISEVRSLHTEEALSAAGVGFDDVTGLQRNRTTTIALDYGRITLSSRAALYLFGIPGQERFSFLWDDLAYGALGAVVLADARRLNDCFASVSYFEKAGLPFAVAVNCFEGAPRYDPRDVHAALNLDPVVPTVLCDARDHESVREVLITLLEVIAATAAPGPG